MSRRPVSIVITAWNAWEATRTCLDSLRPTLGVRDQVIVVDNGSHDSTRSALGHHKWVEVVPNGANLGYAGACNAGAKLARHDILVFLHNDTILSHRWLEPLVCRLEDPAVGACGPRSNFAPGRQAAEGAAYKNASEMRSFARRWAASHEASTSEATALASFAFALTADAFRNTGGFDESYAYCGYEDYDLSWRLLDAGYRLVVCDDSFVHHDGRRTFDANGIDWGAAQSRNRSLFQASHPGADAPNPLVSACLITKDEEANLPSCLDSIKELADEIVVYDTGSTDRTVEVARSLGATVIEGYWDDDFARARNAGLEQCHGDWIAWLDADETLVCEDVDDLRDLLTRTKPEVDAWSVPIHNLTGAGVGAGFVHHACRLFRRATCEWSGRLHEQIAKRGDHNGIVEAVLETASLRHTGYLDEVMRDRDKTERNLRVALAEVENADGWEKGYSLTSLARSLMTAGRMEESYERAKEALDHSTNAITRRMAHRTCADALVALGRLDEAMEQCRALRSECSESLQADPTEAKVRLARGEYDKALDLLDRIGDGGTDSDGLAHTAAMLATQRAEALAGLGRFGDAADTLISVLAEDGVLDAHLGSIVDYLQRSGRPLTPLATAIPAVEAPMFLAQVLQLKADVADDVLEQCMTHMANQTAVLATAATLAKHLPLDRALVWSARLRGAGYGSACPLLALSASPGDPVVRARAAATAAGAFGDPAAEQAFRSAYESADQLEQHAIREEAALLCPALLAPAG